jgi:hypothetical protein
MPDTPEGRTARWAAVVLSSSLVLSLGALFAIFALSSHVSPPALALCLIVAIYIAQIVALNRIERCAREVRKRIWIFSLFMHLPIVLLAAISASLWSWGALIVLSPELISGVLHLRGMGLNATGDARPASQLQR